MRRRAAGLLMLAALWAAPVAAPQVPGTAPRAAMSELDSVMSLLAMRRHGRVEFVEQQFLHILHQPVESSGELLYDAPDRLEKRTLLPRAETAALAATVIRLWQAVFYTDGATEAP